MSDLEQRKARKKSKVELGQQLQEANKLFGSSLEREDSGFLATAFDKIIQNFPLRYKTYLNVLRAIKNKKNIESHSFLETQAYISALNNLEKYIRANDVGVNGSGRKLRPRQLVTFRKVRDFLEERDFRGEGKDKKTARGKIVLPTGVGKTVIFSEFLTAFDMPTLIVVPTEDLLEQTKLDLEDNYPALQNNIVIFNSKKKNFQGKKVVLATHESFARHYGDGKALSFEKFKALIIDEAHEALSDKRKPAAAYFENKGALVLEFTATDEYDEDKKVDSPEIDRLPTADAIKEGLLCPVTTYTAKVRTNLNDLYTNGLVDEEKAHKLAQKHAVYKSCVNLHAEKYSDQNAVVSCNSLDGASEILREFEAKNKELGFEKFKPIILQGELSKEERKQIVKDCKARPPKYNVIIGVKLVTTGLDLPNFSVLYNVSPTTSIVRCGQRGGRVLRLGDDPNKMAYVIDFIYEHDNKTEFGKRKYRKQISYAEYLGSTYVLPKADKKGDKKSKKNYKIPNLRDLTDFGDIEIDLSVVDSLEVSLGRKKASFEQIKFLDDEFYNLDGLCLLLTKTAVRQKSHLDFNIESFKRKLNLSYQKYVREKGSMSMSLFADDKGTILVNRRLIDFYFSSFPSQRIYFYPEHIKALKLVSWESFIEQLGIDEEDLIFFIDSRKNIFPNLIYKIEGKSYISDEFVTLWLNEFIPKKEVAERKMSPDKPVEFYSLTEVRDLEIVPRKPTFTKEILRRLSEYYQLNPNSPEIQVDSGSISKVNKAVKFSTVLINQIFNEVVNMKVDEAYTPLKPLVSSYVSDDLSESDIKSNLVQYGVTSKEDFFTSYDPETYEVVLHVKKERAEAILKYLKTKKEENDRETERLRNRNGKQMGNGNAEPVQILGHFHETKGVMYYTPYQATAKGYIPKNLENYISSLLEEEYKKGNPSLHPHISKSSKNMDVYSLTEDEWLEIGEGVRKHLAPPEGMINRGYFMEIVKKYYPSFNGGVYKFIIHKLVLKDIIKSGYKEPKYVDPISDTYERFLSKNSALKIWKYLQLDEVFFKQEFEQDN